MNVKNRKFQYGDGFFETIIIKEHQIQNWNYHFKRINYALTILKLSSPDNLEEKLKSELFSNAIYENSRIKIQFYRDEESTYLPNQNRLAYHTEVIENTIPFIKIAKTIEFCETSATIPSKYASFKCFMLPYIIAGIEKNNKKIDDLILMNLNHEICESISSNLFWINDGVFYTPSLETGCVNGTMRSFFIDIIKERGESLVEGKFSKKDILCADTVFCTNAAGLTQFKKIEKRELKTINLESFF